MKPEITIVIADDHPIYRQGLRQIIETDPELKILAEVGDGEAALSQIEQIKPTIAIIDVNMPRKDGFEVMKSIREKNLPTSVIFLTMHNDEKYFNSALDSGVKGYVL